MSENRVTIIEAIHSHYNWASIVKGTDLLVGLENDWFYTISPEQNFLS